MATASEQRFAPFEPVPSTRRERWWFSDGVWIDQGQEAAVVGAVWVHWLADRGVPVGDVTLDDAFAREFYFDSQRAAGEKPDLSAGTELANGAVVLQTRGLISGCYRCPDVANVVATLLEHGPVVMGVAWRESMFEPDREAGPPICRVVADSQVVGGHAVLLDGVALDLELGGVTGFVRFKNSWGQGWGEHGLCLLSIADLELLLVDGEALFAVPADGPEAAPEDPGPKLLAASEAEPGPPPELFVYEQEAIGSDRYTTVDSVGYGAYADAIARGIQHVETRPPLTIGIKAPWGAGKTSLMRMVQRRLEWPATWAGQPPDAKSRPVRLGAGPAVTNGALLRVLAGRRGTPPPRTATPEPEPGAPDPDPRWRPTVWFNPWMYQTGEQVWAGFAHELTGQITARMSRGDRERFWLDLNLARVDEQAARRAVYALVFERVLPWLAAAVVLVAAGTVLLAAGVATGLGAGLAASGPAALAAATALRGAGVLRANVSGSLGQVVQPAGAVRRWGGDALAGSFERLVPDPGYAGRAGFFQFMREDAQRVIDLVASERTPLVVFIDDLDRCSPGTVVQVIEAINLFLAGEFRNAIFVIAVEPDMVAAHIEAAYGDLVGKLEAIGGTRAAADALGWRFLEKFIQLPLTLPLMEPERAAGFVGSLFPAAEAAEAAPAAASAPDPAAVAAAQRMVANRSLRESFGLAGAVGATSAAGEAVRREVARKLSRDSEEMQEVIAYGARFLHANPREIKRFANVFRFLVMIATERRLAELDAPDELGVLAKLAVLSTRWPSVVAQLTWSLDSDPSRTVFDLLEDPPRSNANGAGRRAAAERRSLEHALAGCGLSAGASARLLSDDLRRFMRCEPRVGSSARGWL